jgi:hypothetical protein
MTAPPTLPTPIRSHLSDFAARRRRLRLLCDGGYAVVTFAAWMLVWCLVDRLVHLPGFSRAILLASGVLASGYLLMRALRHWAALPDWVVVAEEVEREDPRFGQKLITVTSQILETPDHRGSDQILSRLAEEVNNQIHGTRSRMSYKGVGAALTPWGICVVFVGLALLMSRLPDLRFRQLALRFVAPLADVPAVTTTQLDVMPGDTDVVQSQPVTIEVGARQLGDSSPTVFLSDNQRDWSGATMTPAGNGSFNFTIQSVDRDLRYYVRGGDARTAVYSVRVLRRPAVARFSMRYIYPTYTRLSPATLGNEDGRIEAPVGTHVAMTVTATEPLNDAVISFENQKIQTQATSDPASRRAEWDVNSSATYDIELTSVRGVRGSGPGGCSVRALPDLPPQVKLLRGGESLSQSPREIVPISYEVLDDFAIASLTLRSQVNAQPANLVSLKLWGDPRRQQDVHDFDLAAIPNVAVGDVVTLTLVATDTGGHEVSSLPLQILVSPRTVNLAAYQLIVELARAATLSRNMANALVEARQAHEQSSGQKDRRAVSFQSLGARADRALSSVSQTAGILRQALLKGITHAEGAELAAALANWTDEVELESAAAQEAFRQSGTPNGMDEAGRKELAAACQRAVNLADELETVYRGQQADALIKDLNNLAAIEKQKSEKDPKARLRLNETVERMKQEISLQARQLGLDTGAQDLSRQLDRIQTTGFAVAASRAMKKANYAMVVAQWANELSHSPQKRLGMDARLSAAAQAESIQSDADLMRARDLELASRAAFAVATQVRSGQSGGAILLKAFVTDTSTLLGQARQPSQLHPPAQESALQTRLEAARIDLLRLTGGDVPGSRTGQAATDFQKEIEDLAMQANAAAAAKQYDRAAEIEAALNRKLKSRPRRDRIGTTLPATTPGEGEYSPSNDRIERRRLAAEREMKTARRVDELDQRQTQLADRLEKGEGTTTLAQQQQSVADEIDGVRFRRDDGTAQGYDQPDGRERATAEVLAGIEQLAGMPQALVEAQSLAMARRSAVVRVQSARAATTQAVGDDQRTAATHAADDARNSLTDLTERLGTASQPLQGRVARELGDRLSPYAPETDAAREVIENRLILTLNSLEDAMLGDDADAADRAAADTREAIAATQRELGAARDLLIKRDPLAAARWFARAAAASLSVSPPDVTRAKRNQAGVFESLSRAWGNSIHRAATERLALVPSLAGVLGPPSPNSRGGQGGQSANPFANAQEWGRLRDETSALDPALRDAEPAGYEQPLKLYFEALGRAGDAK